MWEQTFQLHGGEGLSNTLKCVATKSEHVYRTPGQHHGPKLRDPPCSAFRKRPALVFCDLFLLLFFLSSSSLFSVSPALSDAHLSKATDVFVFFRSV
ncbi:hypothetical protein TNCV_1259851 [Trichonephila clavipes]|nr:hypothetical protein TNCV_1259851 [Trichonephila clavipes]